MTRVRILAYSHTRLIAACAVALAACAQAFSPTGGDADREAPRVIETFPAQGATVAAFNDDVVIKFDEMLSERGARVEDVVIVSPATGEVDVDRDGSEIKVSIAGGWKAGQVYHVSVLSGLQDRRSNTRRANFDLIFSTGGVIQPTAVGGIVTDPLTGRPMPDARILAINSLDSMQIYTTVTDTGGFYGLRSLPVGSYNATAFIDQNRNRRLDPGEPRSFQVIPLAFPTDTVVIGFEPLAPDSTPPRMLKAEARDSLQVRLTFDDYIDAVEPLTTVFVHLYQFPDSVLLAGARVMRPREYDVLQRTTASANTRDSAAARPAAGVRPPLPGRPVADTVAVAAADTARLLPSQELVLIPPSPLQARTRYRVVVTGIRNVRGLQSGPTSAAFEGPARPRPAAPVAPDSSRRPVPADTSSQRR